MTVHREAPHTARNAKRKREATEDDEALVLEVVPEAVEVEEPRLDEYATVEVDRHNCLWATVNGRRCRVCLDSGSSSGVLFMPLARALGLVHGGEATETMCFNTWGGDKSIEVVPLPEVVLRLEGGVEVHTPAVVFPEEEGGCYDMNEFVVGVTTMRRGNMLQAFHSRGSSLAIRRPDLLQTVPPPEEPDAKSFAFRVRQQGGAEPLSVLLDTGSRHFAIGHEWARRNRPCGGGSVRRVSVRLGPGCRMHVKEPEATGSSSQPFVMGLRPLRHYHAVFDYSRQLLSFRCGGKRLKVRLHEE